MTSERKGVVRDTTNFPFQRLLQPSLISLIAYEGLSRVREPRRLRRPPLSTEQHLVHTQTWIARANYLAIFAPRTHFVLSISMIVNSQTIQIPPAACVRVFRMIHPECPLHEAKSQFSRKGHPQKPKSTLTRASASFWFPVIKHPSGATLPPKTNVWHETKPEFGFPATPKKRGVLHT